jgi:purine-binding chemotaxis protein CheW
LAPDCTHTGIVVDSVSEVISIKSSDIGDTPGFEMTLSTEYILGMAKKAGSVSILLDIDRVLTSEERILLDIAA